MTTVPCALSLGVPVYNSVSMVEVTATSGKHTAVYTGIVPVSGFGAGADWKLPGPLTLSDDGATLAVVQELLVDTSAPHQIDLSFALTNSSMNAPTMLSIRTATVVFDAVSNGEAAAAASITLGQGAGSPEGGAIIGTFPGNRVYQARYSTDGAANTSTVFANLAPGISFASGLGANSTESCPEAGTIPLAENWFMMESEFSFTLSPGDQASGTSAFVVTPEPATLVLLALGAVPLFRRR
jgi:hypothetical protein